MRFKGIICALGLWALLSSGVEAKEAFYSATEAEVFTNSQIVSATEPTLVLVKITPQNDWHIYWDNPGDSGIPTKVHLSVPQASVKLKAHSAPKSFLIEDIVTQYAYESSAYWLFEVVSETDQPLKMTTDVSWMACRDECVEEALTISSYTSASDIWEKELYQAQKTFPARYVSGLFTVKQDTLHFFIPQLSEDSMPIVFIPTIRDFLNTHQLQTFTFDKDGLWGKAELLPEISIPHNLEGLILSDQKSIHLSLRQDDNLTPPQTEHILWGMILMAFLGGIILNLMPCIFPILFLKALNLIHNAYSPQKVSLESLLYFCGVIFSFMIIAGLLWGLRSGGENIGWGFQLQSPIFVACLFFLFLIIGLMFVGLLNFNAPWLNTVAHLSFRNEKLNAFCTGLFAVLIASPCSAPFMGAAIGYSISQPLYIYFPIFMALAIGYALPFTLIGLFPQVLVKILPKPGAWMVALKRIFAIPIFLTCIWLGWVFYNQIHSSPAPIAEKLDWQPFSQEKLSVLVQQKKPVFIDFTAKWCLTCLVNEKTALASKSFAKLVKTKDITLLKADWTTKDEHITKALATYNRNSVPLYVYYNGNSTNPLILPQLLTASHLKKYLK